MTRERNLLLEARSLIFRYGIKSLTMDDISTQMGISKKTLYQAVENKADLIHKLIEYTINEQKNDFCKVAEKPGNNAIEELLEIYRHNAAMAKSLNPSVLFELKKYYPESYEMLNVFRWDFIYKTVIKNLEAGIAAGLYRDDMNIEIIAKLYSARILEVFNSGLFPPDIFPSNKVLREMFIYHIRGISSQKGLKYLEKEINIDF